AVTRHAARTCGIRKSRFVSPVDLKAGALKLGRKKERSRSIDALDFAALSVAAARFDVVNPKLRSGRVRHTIEKVVVMLIDVKARKVNRVPQVRREKDKAVVNY